MTDAEYWFDVAAALETAIKNWPALPSPLALRHINGEWPEDWARGKRMQREVTLDEIPPKTECEIGAGVWDRITEGKWREVRACQAGEATEETP